MQVDFYRALRSIDVSEPIAREVVETMSAEIASITARETTRQIHPAVQAIVEQMVDLRMEMSELRGHLRTEMGELRSELRSEMSELRTEMGELRAEMGELRGEMKGRFERAEFRAMRFRWVVGTALTMVALGLSGLTIFLNLGG